jgi:hypothetical protein
MKKILVAAAIICTARCGVVDGAAERLATDKMQRCGRPETTCLSPLEPWWVSLGWQLNSVSADLEA